jgi:hypothetical protein
MAALAAQADVESELGRALTSAEAAKVAAALDSASDYVRTTTGRKFAAGTYTVTRYARGGRVRLDSPDAVTAVNIIDYLGTATLVGSDGYTLRGSVLYGLGAGQYEITYTSTGTVPDDLKRVVAAMAARDITEDRQQGATSYTVTKGPFSEAASFDEPQDSIEPTRAEARIIAKYGPRGMSRSLV